MDVEFEVKGRVRGKLCDDVKACEFHGKTYAPLYIAVPESTATVYAEVWGNLARKAEALKKGDEVKLLGRPKERKWTNGEGKNISMTVLVAEKLELVRQEKKRAASKVGYERSM